MRSLPYFFNTRQNMNNLKTDLRLQEVDDGDALSVKVPSGKVFHIKYPANKPATMIGKIVTKGHISAEETSDSNYKQMTVNMNANRTLAPKVCSIAILHNPIYIFLFHWVYWRYLHWFYTQMDFKVLLEAIFGRGELRDFFTNMVFLRESNAIAIVQAVKSETPNTTNTKAKQD